VEISKILHIQKHGTIAFDFIIFLSEILFWDQNSILGQGL